MRDWQVSVLVTVAKSFTADKGLLHLISLILTTIPRDEESNYDPQFMDEKTECPRGHVACLNTRKMNKSIYVVTLLFF